MVFIVEGIRIERVYEPEAQDVSNVAFRMASNTFYTDNHSINSGRSHVDIALVLGMVVERNYVHGFYINKGGYGYGFNVHLSTGVRVTDNKVGTNSSKYLNVFQVFFFRVGIYATTYFCNKERTIMSSLTIPSVI